MDVKQEELESINICRFRLIADDFGKNFLVPYIISRTQRAIKKSISETIH